MKTPTKQTVHRLVAVLSFALAFATGGAFANAAEFAASVWRGETAYAEIPKALQDKATALSAQCAGNGVSLTLLRFDEVKYDRMSELKKNAKGRDYREILGTTSVPDVCREWKPGDAAKPVMIGFDGFLRWAANSWSKDPYDDASYKTESCWVPGDIYLIYPGGELSARLIALRAGVVAAEKMRILSEQEGERGKKAAETVKRLAAPYGFRAAVRGFRNTDPCKLDFAAFRRGVEEFVNSEH